MVSYGIPELGGTDFAYRAAHEDARKQGQKIVEGVCKQGLDRKSWHLEPVDSGKSSARGLGVMQTTGVGDLRLRLRFRRTNIFQNV